MYGGLAVRAIVVCALLLGSATGVAASEAAYTPDTDRQRLPTDAVLQQESTPTAANNSTVQHKDPDTVDEGGDTQRLQLYLANSLAQRLEGSTVNLTQGQYDQARSLLGEEYQQQLEQYADVSGETDGGQSANSFETALEQQQTYINQTQSYRETKAEYQEAVDNGNETRARILARQLAQQADQLNATGSNVTRTYTTVENQTGANLNDEQAAIQKTTQNISTDAASIVESTFIETRLSVSLNRTSASFTDPVRLSGRLLTENGSAVANRSITLVISGRALAVETTANGSFRTVYRPTLAGADADRVTVNYRPGDETAYLGSNDSVPISVRQVEAKLSVEAPQQSTFNQTTTISGSVTVGEMPVHGVPVRITLGDVVLRTVRTNETGRYSLSVDLPASVPAGEQPLRAAIAVRDRAVASATSTRSIRVVPTATTLSLDTTASDPAVIQVAGLLQTESGRELANRTITLSRNGTAVATVETNATGGFSTTISRPAAASNTDAVMVSARFDGGNTSLLTSEETTRVALAGEAAAGGMLQAIVAGNEVILLGGGGVVVLASAAGLFVLLRGREEPTTDVADIEDTAAADQDDTSDESTAGTSISQAEWHGIESLSESEPSVAVERMFTLARQFVAEQYSIAPSLTHREFGRAYRAAATDAPIDDLTALLELYERAAFSSEGVSEAEAAQALQHLESVLEALDVDIADGYSGNG